MTLKIVLPILFFTALIFFACSKKLPTQITDPAAFGKSVIERSIESHGGVKYDDAHYSFVFREKTYTFKNQNGGYKYTQNGVSKDGTKYFHVLENGNFKRIVDSQEEKLSEKKIRGYSNSLNSVIYFATLPHKLKDSSVNYLYKGKTTILNKDYFAVQISFDQEGGGDDHDDIYYYWVNVRNYRIEYLAYNFHVNGGGVRFRSAFHPQIVDGILFQDFVNYKAPKDTPLEVLPKMFEKKSLVKLSEIKTEQVKNLKK